MHQLSQSVLGYLRKHDLLRPGDRIGVAVSGGADSVALLRILLELRDELGLVLDVVHLNHLLRGEESDGDEQFVRALAEHHDLPFFSARRDVKTHATGKKLSIEAAAREVRYQYFEELLRDGEFNKLATAHTLDDQAETVLLKLMRGAGTRGLAGIYPKVRAGEAAVVQKAKGKARAQESEPGIIRPLLAIQRAELEEYLARVKQGWREDSTNLELRHTRNRIRHEILPRLREYVNPQARQTLAEVADVARAEEEFWEQETQRHLALVWSHAAEGGALRCAPVNGLSLALRRRLMRAAAESLGLHLEFSHVEEVLALSTDGSQTALPKGWTARRKKGLIYFAAPAQTVALDYEYGLPVPGNAELFQAHLVIRAVPIFHNGSEQSYNPDHLLDARFGGDLVVRNWRAGDRFWPSNTKQPRKIKELLQDRHITGDEKKRWPVIASGDEVVWVRGFGVRHDLQARNGSGILITEEPLAKDH